MTKQEIMRLASMSKLEFTDAELSKFEQEFDAVLKFVSAIEKAQITSAKSEQPSINLVDLRDDEVAPSLPREAVLSNAPESDGTYFVVPKVVE